MDIINATIKLNEEGKIINQRDLINDNFDCEILVNESKLIGSIQLKKNNNITYNFKNKYTKLSLMFDKCKLLTIINLSNLITDNVTDIDGMFQSCTSLKSINLDSFNTNKIYLLCFLDVIL